MKSNLCEMNGCNLNSTYELIEDMANLNWLAMRNLHVKRPNAAMEQLVLEMAYSQSPINNVNKNWKLREFSIKTHMQHEVYLNH